MSNGTNGSDKGGGGGGGFKLYRRKETVRAMQLDQQVRLGDAVFKEGDYMVISGGDMDYQPKEEFEAMFELFRKRSPKPAAKGPGRKKPIAAPTQRTGVE